MNLLTDKLSMRALLFLSLFIHFSCGMKTSPLVMGQTTRAQLIEHKGEPLRIEKLPLPDSHILIYTGEEKFQTKGEIITNSFRNPHEEEKLLLYWKHKFRNCSVEIKEIEKKDKGHTPADKELICSEMGLSVIYSEGSGKVIRVLEHEKQ
jgi:hypothetical protein